MTVEIKLNPETSGPAFDAGQNKLGQAVSPGGQAPAGVRPGMATAAGGTDSVLNGTATSSSDRAGTTAAATREIDQSARTGGERVNGVANPGGPGGNPASSLLDKANAARMAPSDLMKAGLNPYISNNPLMKAVQGIPSVAAQMLPQALNMPAQILQSGISPTQSMLGGPGAISPLLTEMLGRANAKNGFDGGPASLAIPGGATTEAGARLQSIAQGVVGKFPYAWGGGGPNGPGQGISDGGGPGDAAGDYRKIGFDCSGLSQYVWKQMYGVTIPEVSQTQYSQGIPVSAGQAKPGDLVFPAGSFGSGGPGHVQILMPGGTTVLEAPSSGQMVKISPLQSGSQFRTFSTGA